MAQILRTRASRIDYDEIWEYIAIRDLVAADRLIDSFEATLNVIASAPDIGRKVEGLSQNLRCFPVGSHLIFYRPVGEHIQLFVFSTERGISPQNTSRIS